MFKIKPLPPDCGPKSGSKAVISKTFGARKRQRKQEVHFVIWVSLLLKSCLNELPLVTFAIFLLGHPNVVLQLYCWLVCH